MANLEDTVRLVVEDFIKNGMLFTALDVSNAVKQVLPHARHREVRDVVRNMFPTDIEPQGWARTPITVTLGDGSSAEALLYHGLADSWDLDNKYDNQKRGSVSYRPVATAQATVAVAQTTVTPLLPPAPSVVTPMPNARDLWNQMFQTQPSLFPRK